MGIYHPKWKKIVKYPCDYVKKAANELKFRFRKMNGTDAIEKHGGRDRMYEEYCKEIDAFIAQCKCDTQTDNKGQGHEFDQPERSKREDLVDPSCCGRPMRAVFGNPDGWFCDNCADWKPRCGALNSMET